MLSFTFFSTYWYRYDRLARYSTYNQAFTFVCHKFATKNLNSQLLYHSFWPVLLLDALPLLQQSEDEGSGVVVTAAHTYELMYCLNTVTELASSPTYWTEIFAFRIIK